MKRLLCALGVVGVIAGCNAVLGLEDHDLRAPTDAAAPETGPDGATRERGFEPCLSDADCIAPNACYTPRCNTELGVCTYRLCSTDERPCSIGTCDTSTFHCSEPKTYGTRSTRYPIDGVTIACKSNDICIAAAYPFAVIGAVTGPVALLVDDLVGANAVKLPVDGVTFKATQVIASGRRIWLLGDTVGSAAPFEMPIAFIDVPSDPTVKSLHATSSTVLFPYAGAKAFPSTSGALLLVRDDPAEGFAAVRISPPLVDRATAAVVNVQPAPNPAPALPMYRLPAPPAAGTTAVAVSGGRLVLYRPGAVSFVNGVATPSLVITPDTAVVPTLGAPHFASGLEGEVAAIYPVVADAPAPDCNCGSHARIQWFVQSAGAAAFDVNVIGDTEGWVNPGAVSPPAVCHTCAAGYFAPPGALGIVDGRTVVAVATATENRGVSSTRVVTRDPVGTLATQRVVRAATDVPPGNLPVDRVGYATSTGYAYELFANGEGNAVNLSIYDPRCETK